MDNESKYSKLIGPILFTTVIVGAYVTFTAEPTQSSNPTGDFNQLHEGQSDLENSNNSIIVYDSANKQSVESETSPNCDSTPPGYITNFETCADYKLVPDPRNNTRLCAEKGFYTNENERTLFGLRRVVGMGTEREIEIIDQSTREVIGYFPVGVNASFESMFKPAAPSALACLVYNDVSSD